LDVPGAQNETGFNNLALSLANKSNNGNVHSHDASTQEALGWITDHQDEAFFLYLAYPIPHVSVQAPAHLDDLTDADGLVFDNSVRTAVDEFYPDRPFGEPIAHPGTGAYTATTDKRHEYAAMISAMDRDIGRIRALLESLDLDEDTLIIFTSDNGVTFLGEVDQAYFNSAAGLSGSKGNLYEGGIRAPFLACWPGRIPAGTSSSILGNLDDIMPTLADLTSTPCNADTTGRSILPTLLGQPPGNQIPKPHVYHEFSSNGWARTVRRGDWKLHRYVDKTTGASRRELYDLATDPTESTNLHGSNPVVAAELERIMDGDHAPSELFFRPTDEFGSTTGVEVSSVESGFRLEGNGQALSPLLKDVSGRATFKLSIRPDGSNGNGAFHFGFGPRVSSLIKAEVDLEAGLMTLSRGGDEVSAPLSGAGIFELSLSWDPGTSTVTLLSGSISLSLPLAQPPAMVDHIGYSVRDGGADFSPVSVFLDLPELPQSLRMEASSTGVLYSYRRPLDANGTYSNEQSHNLVDWEPAPLLYEQAFTRFGGIQEVQLRSSIGTEVGSRPEVQFFRVRFASPDPD
jgi:hypothetical protein